MKIELDIPEKEIKITIEGDRVKIIEIMSQIGQFVTHSSVDEMKKAVDRL